jgi:hypothetical protein
MNPFSAWLTNIGFAIEAQQVIGLRLLRLAQGNTLATKEASAMIAEKIAAFSESQIAAGLALTSGCSIHAAMGCAAAPYRRRVRANHKRLTRPKRDH